MKDNRAVISLLNNSYAILFLIMVAPVLAFAQGGDTVFTVKQAKASVSISPAADALYKNVSKKFTLTKPEGTIIDTIIFAEGSTMRRDSVFLIKPSKTGTGMLKIYGHAGGGKRQLLLVKEFVVNTFAEPRPNLDGVDCDSAIHRMKVVAQGYVNVPMNNDPDLKRVSHKVLSFEMQSPANGQMDTLKATGNRITYDMRDKIDKMQEGSVIQIGNIRYLFNDDTFVIRQPLRVYLRNDKINKF